MILEYLVENCKYFLKILCRAIVLCVLLVYHCFILMCVECNMMRTMDFFIRIVRFTHIINGDIYVRMLDRASDTQMINTLKIVTKYHSLTDVSVRCAVCRGHSEEVVAYVLRHAEDTNKISNSNIVAEACMLGNVGVLEPLLQHGYNPNVSVGIYNWNFRLDTPTWSHIWDAGVQEASPLLISIVERQEEMTKLLLLYGADDYNDTVLQNPHR